MRRALVATAAVLGALCAGPAAAVAHPLLVQAAPAPGLLAPQAPGALRLAFSEPAVARGSSVVLKGPKGRRIAVTGVVSENGGRTLSITPKRRLTAGVYSLRWVALGNDGHTVSGRFSFGIAGRHGRAPAGASQLQAQTGAGGSGSERAATESPVAVLAGWLGLVAASFLAGGLLLVLLLRRRDPDTAELAARRWRVLAPAAIPALSVSAVVGAVAAAGRGTGGLDPALLTASPNGRLALGRLAFVLAAGAVASRLRARTRPYEVAGAVLGAGALVSFALAGHVLSSTGSAAPAVIDQLVHVLAAGLWLGGVLLLTLVAAKAGAAGRRSAVRAFAPAAAMLLLLAVAAGVVAAVREVDGWYFLRWSGYGQVVLIKSALVVLVVALGAFATLRARAERSPSPRFIRGEAVVLLAVVALAVVLSGTTQGRGQLLPARRGTLLPGPAFAGAILGNGSAGIVVAPARPGLNTIAVDLTARAAASSHVTLRLTCACAKQPVIATLARPRSGGAWSASVWLPAAGPWFAYATVGSDSSAAPAVLRIGVPRAPGAPVENVLSVADLSGPDASRCRDHELGLELALGRINSAGGVNGGHKIAPYVLDDRGDAHQAQALVADALRRLHPLAFVPCGKNGEAAVKAAAAAGVPSLIGDPAVAPVHVARAFRAAGDPFAEGVAAAQHLKRVVMPSSAPTARAVRMLAPQDPSGKRFAAGLQSAIGSRLHLATIAAPRLTTATGPALAHLLDRRRTLAFVLDGAPGPDYAAAFRRLGAASAAIPPAPFLATSRVLSEDLVEASGELGRIGILRGLSEVTPDAADALVYARAVPAIYPGERPSLDGLRGYIAGLALRATLRGGTGPGGIAERLLRPAPFTDTLGSPWRSDAPAAGSVRFTALAPRFLASTLIPVSAGGESYDGSFFADGAWTRVSTELYGPSLDSPVPSF